MLVQNVSAFQSVLSASMTMTWSWFFFLSPPLFCFCPIPVFTLKPALKVLGVNSKGWCKHLETDWKGVTWPTGPWAHHWVFPTFLSFVRGVEWIACFIVKILIWAEICFSLRNLCIAYILLSKLSRNRKFHFHLVAWRRSFYNFIYLTFVLLFIFPSHRHHVFQGASLRCLHKGRTKQSRGRRGRSDQPWWSLLRLIPKWRWRNQRRQHQTLLSATLHASPALPLQRRGWRRGRGGLRWKRSRAVQVRPEHTTQAALFSMRRCGLRLSLWCGIMWGLQGVLQENHPRWVLWWSACLHHKQYTQPLHLKIHNIVTLSHTAWL